MLIRHADDVQGHPADLAGAEGVTFRLVLGDSEGAPNFFMRQFDIIPGGHTPHHAHAHEHEVYVLAGTGVLVTDAGEQPIGAGDAALVAPNEAHQFRSTGVDDLKLLCFVP
ncbi:MAG: cupin domain-containing protein, partial [Planctomycetota bacterium]